MNDNSFITGSSSSGTSLFSISSMKKVQTQTGEPLRLYRIIIMASLLTSAVLAVSDWQKKVPDSDRTRPNPIAPSPESIAAGKEIYAVKCAKCHGANAEGKGHHPSLQTKEIHSASAGELEWLIAHGNRWHGMPAYESLSQEQRWQLVSYIQSLPTASN
jgi:mono/diheme cytochrome c family protein